MLTATCRLGPQYEREQKFYPDSYRYSLDESENIADTDWWVLFNDSVLTGLIDSALSNNLDLEASVSRIIQAEAQLGVVRADLFPRVNYGVRRCVYCFK